VQTLQSRGLKMIVVNTSIPPSIQTIVQIVVVVAVGAVAQTSTQAVSRADTGLGASYRRVGAERRGLCRLDLRRWRRIAGARFIVRSTMNGGRDRPTVQQTDVQAVGLTSTAAQMCSGGVPGSSGAGCAAAPIEVRPSGPASRPHGRLHDFARRSSGAIN